MRRCSDYLDVLGVEDFVFASRRNSQELSAGCLTIEKDYSSMLIKEDKTVVSLAFPLAE